MKTENTNKTIATVIVVTAGAAIVEAALVPGIILGATTVAASTLVVPLFDYTLRKIFKLKNKTTELREHIKDIVDEVEKESVKVGEEVAADVVEKIIISSL